MNCERVHDQLTTGRFGRELRWSDAELNRIRGELLCLLERPPTEIEACFRRAMDIANDQGARAWNLRAATSLARFWAPKGKATEARKLLAPIYDGFTEGFDIADLKDANALLDELS